MKAGVIVESITSKWRMFARFLNKRKMRAIATPLLLGISALSVVAGLFFVSFVLDMYHLKPDRWGPPGVAFEVWHHAWRSRRDSYFWSAIGSLVIALACAAAGLLPFVRHAAEQLVGPREYLHPKPNTLCSSAITELK